jgi:chemotaxis signal transduction protein
MSNRTQGQSRQSKDGHEVLKQRAARLAARPPQVRQTQAAVIAFVLNDDRWALALDQVERLIKTDGLRRLPQVPPTVRGALHHQGQLLTVLDLGLLLGRGPITTGPAARVIVVAVPASLGHNRHHDNASSQVGLLVGSVIGVETPDHPLQPALTSQTGLAGHWDDLALIDLAALLQQQAERFSQ